MIKFITILALIVVLLFLAPMISGNQGLLHIEIASYVIETSVAAGIVIILVFMLLCYLLLGIAGWLLGVKGGLLSWFNESRTRSADRKLARAVRAYLTGDFEQAQDCAEKSLKWSSVPEVSRLLAIAGGYRSGDTDRVIRGYDLVNSDNVDDHFAVCLFKAQEFIARKEWSSALRIAEALRNTCKDNHQVNRVYFDALVALDRYAEIEENRELFMREGLLDDGNYFRLISSRIVKEVKYHNDVGVLKQMMKDLPRDISGRTEVVLAFAERFLELGEDDRAFKMTAALVRDVGNREKVFSGIAAWRSGDRRILELLNELSQEEKSFNHLAAKANMHLVLNEPEKARELYDVLVREDPRPLYYIKLGQCFQNSGRTEQAALFYQEAAKLAYLA